MGGLESIGIRLVEKAGGPSGTRSHRPTPIGGMVGRSALRWRSTRMERSRGCHSTKGCSLARPIVKSKSSQLSDRALLLLIDLSQISSMPYWNMRTKSYSSLPAMKKPAK